jgi:hypothetical protein
MSLSKAGKYGAGITHPSPELHVAKKKRSRTLKKDIKFIMHHQKLDLRVFL